MRLPKPPSLFVVVFERRHVFLMQARANISFPVERSYLSSTTWKLDKNRDPRSAWEGILLGSAYSILANAYGQWPCMHPRSPIMLLPTTPPCARSATMDSTTAKVDRLPTGELRSHGMHTRFRASHGGASAGQVGSVHSYATADKEAMKSKT